MDFSAAILVIMKIRSCVMKANLIQTFFLFSGCWLECQSDAECLDQCRDNVTLLYKNGVFGSFVELLNLEMECVFYF